MDTMHDYALHYDSVFRQLNIERPVLVGHSLGGWMAAEFASTYPDRLASLVLVNAAGFPFDESDNVPDFFAAAARGGVEFAQLVFHKMDVAAQFFPAKPTPEEILQTFRHLTSTARIAWHVWFDDKMPQRLKRLMCPTLALWGAHDRIFPASLGGKYADAIPNATFKVFDDCGHMVPFESPQAFVEAILGVTR
jgi:pimeloyl-ACP methyl ester carboxylesterase